MTYYHSYMANPESCIGCANCGTVCPDGCITVYRAEVRRKEYINHKKLYGKEVKLMKGNEALAHGAIRYGADGYFGYPITPQSEVLECFMEEVLGDYWYGGASGRERDPLQSIWFMEEQYVGKRVMTSTSSPGWSSCKRGAAYLAGMNSLCAGQRDERRSRPWNNPA